MVLTLFSSLPSIISWFLIILLLFTLSSIVFHIFRYLYIYLIYSSQQLLSQYKGHWAIVTGASQGIGLGYVDALASHGLNIILISRDPSKLEHAVKQIKSKYPKVEALSIPFDFSHTDLSQYTSLFQRIHDIAGSHPISILINNVGGTTNTISGTFKPFQQCTQQELINVVALNLLSSSLMNHHFLPLMQQQTAGGVIINVTSMSGTEQLPFQGIYPATKTAIDTLTLTLGDELRNPQTPVKGRVIVESHIPGEVVSATNQSTVTMMAPAAMTWASLSVRRMGAFAGGLYPYGLAFPYFPHAASAAFLHFIPIPAARRITTQAILDTWKRVSKQR